SCDKRAAIRRVGRCVCLDIHRCIPLMIERSERCPDPRISGVSTLADPLPDGLLSAYWILSDSVVFSMPHGRPRANRSGQRSGCPPRDWAGLCQDGRADRLEQSQSPYLSTTVFAPLMKMRRSACHFTARFSTTLSRSEPMLMRSSGDMV